MRMTNNAIENGMKNNSTEQTLSGVTIVIPAFNEEGRAHEEVAEIARVLNAHTIAHEIILVNDGSTDQTAERAARAGARVLQHPHNRGYGASLKTGIVAARYNAIVITDADGTYPAEEIPTLVAQLQTADMVVGARTGKRVHIPWIRKPGKWLLGFLANHVAGQTIPDLNSGLRAFHRDTVQQYFPILSNRFSFTTTVTLALLADDYRVVYHPIDYLPRVGKSKITPRNFMDFSILVVRMAMLFQPLKIFVPLALTFGVAGVLKVVYDIVSFALRTGKFDLSLLYQPVLSTSAILLLLVGLQVLFIGMLADGIIRRLALRNEPSVASRGVTSFEYETKPGIGRG